MDCYIEVLGLLEMLYGKDTIVSFATVNGTKANLRYLNAYYKDKAFFITTYALSSKVKEISSNPSCAIAHNLFVAHGDAINIGHPLDEENKALREELKCVFYSFYDKHVDENDKNTCILKVNLADAIVFANNYKYYVDFKSETAVKEDSVVDIVF